MHLDPLWAAGPVIASHALLAIGAFGIGIAQFALPKGTTRHRVMGWAWVLMMGAVAFGSFFISEIGTFGYFSWIHLLSAYTLFALFGLVRAARAHRIRSHRNDAMFLFLGALVIAGAFTFMPFRVMNDVVTGSTHTMERR